MRSVTIEIHDGTGWVDCLVVAPRENGQTTGANGPIEILYDNSYATKYWGGRDARAASVTMPVEINYNATDRWPAWLIDLLPQGFGRQRILQALKIEGADGPQYDWLVLSRSGNPVGNMRIKGALPEPPANPQGFTYEDVGARTPEFVEFLGDEQMYLAGSSGLQGEWPKILLVEGHDGRLYLDHHLPDVRVVAHWLAKFLIDSQKQEFIEILDTEFRYFECLRHLSIHTSRADDIRMEGSVMMVRRFDRGIRGGKVERLAQESLYSLSGKYGMQPSMSHNDACAAIRTHSSDPVADVIEYVRRDLANQVLQNPDNHGRNTAFSRDYAGRIWITPAFDVAPMYRHPSGIARRLKWQEADRRGSTQWEEVVEETGLDQEGRGRLVEALHGMVPRLHDLAELAHALGVPDHTLQRIRKSANAHAERIERILTPKASLTQTRHGRPKI